MGIVIELQQEALSNDTAILDLLRKAYLVARKLKLKEFEEWIDHEMNGYGEDDKIPQYRIYHGEVKGWNPYNGWIPVVFQDAKLQDILSEHKAREPIASLVDVYKNSEERIAKVLFPDSINDMISNSGLLETKYCLQISTNMLFSTIESIRNTILDWAITLEENGIIGEGLRFTNDEIKTARESSTINNFINNFYADVNNTQMQQGTENSKQDHER